MRKKIRRTLTLRLARLGFKGLFYMSRSIPLRGLYFLVNFVSVIFYNLVSRNRKLALRNLSLALGNELAPEKLKLIAKQSFKTMGQTALETVYYPQLDHQKVRRLIKIEGKNHLDDALGRGMGVVGISAHLGSFTLLGYRLILEGYNVSFVARHMRDERLERIFLKLCHTAGQNIIFSRPIFTCIRQCLQALSRNEILILELDQNFGAEGVPVVFFGKRAMVATGPVVLSRLAKAQILPIFINKESNKLNCIKIKPALKFELERNTKEEIRSNMQKIVFMVEQYIRKYPGQWTSWIHKPWQVK